ncbi:MAG: biopolymer transporter ExbD [Verrucomicrobia bacterium]|nr:biopolymer transporter ExbD [Verrucomicrobiota bacterium]MDE3099925.1 biopolymer transporter ExbD [Verrucomicrobiota bacterium]
MKKTSRSHHGTLSELNITPLLDLVFVLLVIFIITTPQLMNELVVNLPSGKPPPQKPHQPKINEISVATDGQISLNGTFVSAAQLKDSLRRMQAQDPDIAVVVKGADQVDYQHMVNVLDVLQQLDIQKVGLATEAP